MSLLCGGEHTFVAFAFFKSRGERINGFWLTRVSEASAWGVTGGVWLPLLSHAGASCVVEFESKN